MAPLFQFVQFEFTHGVGPAAGRYVVGGDGVERTASLIGVTMKPATADVLAITITSAPASLPRLRRRAKEDKGEERDVPLLQATFIRATQPLEDERAADRALDAIAGDEDAQQAWVNDGLAVLNRAIRAYRAGAHDPYVMEVAQRDARRVRIGFGTTEDVASGRWRRAIALPPPVGIRASRTERLAPTEVTADVLTGRGGVLEGEDVLLRAYVDLDHGRVRAAAQQVRAGLELLALELPEHEAELRAGEIDLRSPDVAELEALIARAERVVEGWRYAALEL